MIGYYRGIGKKQIFLTVNPKKEALLGSLYFQKFSQRETTFVTFYKFFSFSFFLFFSGVKGKGESIEEGVEISHFTRVIKAFARWF